MARVPSKLDWGSFVEVQDFAQALARESKFDDMIVFYNGHNYQITFASRRKEIEAKGYNVVITVYRDA